MAHSGHSPLSDCIQTVPFSLIHHALEFSIYQFMDFFPYKCREIFEYVEIIVTRALIKPVLILCRGRFEMGVRDFSGKLFVSFLVCFPCTVRPNFWKFYFRLKRVVVRKGCPRITSTISWFVTRKLTLLILTGKFDTWRTMVMESVRRLDSISFGLFSSSVFTNSSRLIVLFAFSTHTFGNSLESLFANDSDREL